MNSCLAQRLESARAAMTAELLGQLGPGGHWLGELSSSALSTATAVIALAEMDRAANASLISKGLDWLAANANPDGGWGDTIRSKSNLSTTALVWAAFGGAQADDQFPSAVKRATAWIERAAGSLQNPLQTLVPAIEARYGEDRTFSVPIVMTLALSGRLGPNGWRHVRPLPFELAVMPRGFYGALRLPVVSYALPALIAIGQVIHHRSGRWNPLRSAARARTLDLLARLQPSNGGFLEATPLTSFVTMSLAGMNLRDHIVAQRGADFLRRSARPDGSWPIDTNLATWVTTLSVKALRGALDAPQRARLLDWLLAQQFKVVHPYTGAAPGGWAWTDLPGGVPDADDTAGAIVALRELAPEPSPAVLEAARSGMRWLLGVQNSDGGIPTFCRGWGKLPFDRSTPELTAHALRAWTAFPSCSRRLQAEPNIRRAERFLARSQLPNGSWLPLWFGNEHAESEANPVYGTAQVVIALNKIDACPELARRGANYLAAQQNEDGGWGAEKGRPSTIEETSLALEALASAAAPNVQRGLHWLVEAIENRAFENPAPIGLYFARLWYYERLYPLIFAAGALNQFKAASNRLPSKASMPVS